MTHTETNNENNDKHWKTYYNEQYWKKTMNTIEKQIKYNEKHWKTMKTNEKQIIKNIEKNMRLRLHLQNTIS